MIRTIVFTQLGKKTTFDGTTSFPGSFLIWPKEHICIQTESTASICISIFVYRNTFFHTGGQVLSEFSNFARTVKLLLKWYPRTGYL